MSTTERNMPTPSVQSPQDFAVSVFALAIGAAVWLIVFTFPSFFFVNPFGTPGFLRTVNLLLSLAGWLVLSTAPTIMLMLYAAGRRRAIRFLPVAALLWPTSLILSHLVVYRDTKTWYGTYLIDYPIFGFTDIALPVMLVLLWSRLRTAD